jgi:hypothetical protein
MKANPISQVGKTNLPIFAPEIVADTDEGGGGIGDSLRSRVPKEPQIRRSYLLFSMDHRERKELQLS